MFLVPADTPVSGATYDSARSSPVLEVGKTPWRVQLSRKTLLS